MSESKTLRQKVQKEEGGGEGEWVGCSRCPVPGGWVGGGAVGSGEFGDPGGGQGRRWGSPAPLGRRGSALYTGLPWELMGREGDTALLGCLPPRSAGSLWGARPGAGAPGLRGGLLPQAVFQRRILPAFLPLRFPSLLSSLHPFLFSFSSSLGVGKWAGERGPVGGRWLETETAGASLFPFRLDPRRPVGNALAHKRRIHVSSNHFNPHVTLCPKRRSARHWAQVALGSATRQGAHSKLQTEDSPQPHPGQCSLSLTPLTCAQSMWGAKFFVFFLF